MTFHAVLPHLQALNAAASLTAGFIPGWLWVVAQVAVGGFGLFLILGTLVSLTRFPQWWIRTWDFPRLQIAVLGPAIALLWWGVARGRDWSTWDWLFLAALGVMTLWQAWRILPWLPLASEEVADVDPPDAPRDRAPKPGLKAVVSNVLQKNDQHDRWALVVLREQPDIIVTAETDQKWIDEIARTLGDDYPHRLAHPLDNNYGLSLWCRRPLSDTQIEFLVQDDIPSFHTTVEIEGGEKIRIHALHPRPPVPEERDSSSPRDAELVLMGRQIAEQREDGFLMPTLVLGDLNDVAWSRTTRLFQKLSGLLDPRRGRGFYNSFNAESWWMRFPLDHVFVSRDFRLVELRVLDYVGSDHFPVCITLEYDPSAQDQNEQLDTTREDKEEAQEILQQQVERETNGDEEGHLHTSPQATDQSESPGEGARP